MKNIEIGMKSKRDKSRKVSTVLDRSESFNIRVIKRQKINILVINCHKNRADAEEFN